jgi:ribose transport system permease protein
MSTQTQHEPAVAAQATKREPSRVPLLGISVGDFIERYALIGAWIIVIALFGALEPSTFLSSANFTSIFGSQAVLVVLTLALLVPLTSGDYDLSVASILSLAAMMIATLNAERGWPILLAILAAVVVSMTVGLINGLIMTTLAIDSLIVTLGMGTILQGVVLWISGSQAVSGVSTHLVDAVIGTRVFGIPLEFYYGFVCCAGLGYVFHWTPIGRRLLFVGRGRAVARLSGMHVSRIRVGAMMASGGLAALGGVLFVGTAGSADPSSAQTLLLPAFAASFLGSTAIRPGRFNPWGSFIAVYFLVTGITGLQLLGVDAFVQQLFYGGALITAVALRQILRRNDRLEDTE